MPAGDVGGGNVPRWLAAQDRIEEDDLELIGVDLHVVILSLLSC